MSRTSAGAELSDALQAVGSATKDKAADTAKKVKTKTAKASDSISSAFDTAARRSWRTRRKTDRRSRVYARKRRRQLARAEQAKLRAKAAAASMAEAAAKLVSGDEEVPKKKRTSAKTFAFTLLAAGATLAVIQQLLGRRHADTTSTNGSGAEPGQSGPEQATATATEATDAATDQAAAATEAAMDQAAAATDAAMDQAAAATDAATEKVSELSAATADATKKAAAKATSPRKRTARTTYQALPVDCSGRSAVRRRRIRIAAELRRDCLRDIARVE